jgi:FkbM family methyltransferase
LTSKLIKNIVEESSLIIDIGANVGQTFLEYKSINPNAIVVSIEANPQCEEALKQSGANYKIIALGEKAADNKDFYINKNEPTCQGASFFKENTAHYEEGNFNTIKVPTITLDELTGFQTFDFIKIDTQGSEMSIINGGVNTLSRTKWLLIELPVLEYNAGSASSEEIINRLYEIGFTPKQIIKDNKFEDVVVQQDVLFINTKYDQEALGDDSPRKTLGVKYDLLLWAYEKIKPQYFVEVGTYKCQTSIGLFKTHLPNKAYLIDLFEKAPPEELPPNDLPITSDQAVGLIQENFGDDFDCGVVVGNSIDTLPVVVDAINSFDAGSTFIFVDGGHSYDTTLADLMNVNLIKHELYVAIDDANFSEVAPAIDGFINAVRDRNPQLVAHRPNLVIFKLDPHEHNAYRF